MAIDLGISNDILDIEVVRTLIVPDWMFGGGGTGTSPPPTEGQIWPRGEKATG